MAHMQIILMLLLEECLKRLISFDFIDFQLQVRLLIFQINEKCCFRVFEACLQENREPLRKKYS